MQPRGLIGLHAAELGPPLVLGCVLRRSRTFNSIEASTTVPVPSVASASVVVTQNDGEITFQRLPQVPPPPAHIPEQEVSAIQREREEILAIYESPSNLAPPVRQVNRDAKEGSPARFCPIHQPGQLGAASSISKQTRGNFTPC